MYNKTIKIGRFLLVFVLVSAWIFSGWPQIFNFPPKIQEAKAETEIKKPTTHTDAPGNSWTNPGQCYDTATAGDETTEGNVYNFADENPDITFHTWDTKGQTYTATVLKVKWKTSGSFSNDKFAIQYSKDGGNLWNDLVPLGVHNETTIQTSSTSLDANQDLSQVQIKVVEDRFGVGDKDYIYIYDIWTEGTYTSLSTTFLIGGTETGTKDTHVTDIIFPEGEPGATITAPYNDVDTSSDPQVLSPTVSEPVVKIKNTHATQSYNLILEITTWTNSLVNMEYYNLAADGATDIQTVTAELSNANGAARTVSTGVSIAAGAYKDLYLRLVLASVAGKTGTSTLTVLGEAL